MLIQIKCQNCGSNIKVDSNNKKYICEHCGAEFIIKETVNNFQTVNEYHTTQNIVKHVYGKDVMDATDFIQNADVFVSLGEFNKAEDLYNKAININPADWRGWFGIVKVRTLNFSKIEDKTHLEFLSKAKKVATKEQLLEIEEQYREFSLKVEKERQRKEELQHEEYLRRQEFLKQKKIEEERKKKKKKISIISIVVVFVVALAVFIPIITHITTKNAAEKKADLEARNGIILEEKQDYYIVTGLEVFNENIIIPSSYKGKEVKEISPKAFANTNIKSVEVPDSIVSIGLGAFSGCSNLEKITLPFIGGGDVEVEVNSGIEPNIFGYIFGTSKFENSVSSGGMGETSSILYYIPSKLNTVIITGGDLPIGAFSGCSNISDITLPKSVTTISKYAFYNCNSLKSINIPLGATTIKENAFYMCSKLESVFIPSSIQTIEASAFYFCDSIKNVYIEDISAWCNISFADYYCNPLYYAENFYLNDLPITNLVLPEGVTSIGDFAFYNYLDLIHITLPSSLSSIGSSAFYGCHKLIEVCNLSNNLTIKEGFPDNGFVGNYAKSIITTPQSNINIIDDYILFSDQNTNEYHLLGYVGSENKLVLPEKISNNPYSVYDYAFYLNTNINEVIIPSSVTAIGVSAFEGCSALSSITLSDGLTSISEKAFKKCSNLVEIMIPNSVSFIGEGALNACSALESVTIPFIGKESHHIEKSESAVFGYVFGKEGYIGGDSVSQYYDHKANVYYTATYCIPTTLKNVVVTGGEISYGAFSRCESLISVTLPENAAILGSSAFEGCAGLESIIFPKNLAIIEGMAFYNCSSLKNITLPNTLTTIGNQAFSYCTALSNITIPDSVTSLGNGTFMYCSSLNNVHLGNGITSIESSTFSYCNSLVSIVIPINVTSISSGAFIGSRILNSVAFMDTTTWYSVNTSSNWPAPIGGTEIDVSKAEENARHFLSALSSGYWYKL